MYCAFCFRLSSDLSTWSFLASLCMTGWNASAQTTIHVPADQPTIQSGIDAAINGDTVLVAPGTYSEGIDFKGKAITVTSSGGAAQTILDARQFYVGVLFHDGETQASVLNGFTIQNAGENLWPNSPLAPYMDGIQIISSNPTITKRRLQSPSKARLMAKRFSLGLLLGTESDTSEIGEGGRFAFSRRSTLAALKCFNAERLQLKNLTAQKSYNSENHVNPSRLCEGPYDGSNCICCRWESCPQLTY